MNISSRYKKKAWRELTDIVKRRDDYLCQECRRYGRTSGATLVHHVYPTDQYPELFYNPWNLISLCTACHEKMHDRKEGTLTATGEYWKRKREKQLFKNKLIPLPEKIKRIWERGGEKVLCVGRIGRRWKG